MADAFIKLECPAKTALLFCRTGWFASCVALTNLATASSLKVTSDGGWLGHLDLLAASRLRRNVLSSLRSLSTLSNWLVLLLTEPIMHKKAPLKGAFLRMAGAPGFEPGITGSKPGALPLGYAPAAMKERTITKLAASFNIFLNQKRGPRDGVRMVLQNRGVTHKNTAATDQALPRCALASG